MSETPPYLGPTDVFSKKPTYDCSSALNNGDSAEKVHLLPKMAVPRPFCQKTARIGPKRHFLQFFRWGIAIFGRSGCFSSSTYYFNAELQTYVGFFEKTSVGPRSGVLLAGFRVEPSPNLGGGLPKKGAKNISSPKFNVFF